MSSAIRIYHVLAIFVIYDDDDDDDDGDDDDDDDVDDDDVWSAIHTDHASVDYTW